VKSFLKAVHVINYSQQALSEVAQHVAIFAEAEDLPAHGDAVRRRFHKNASLGDD
jgi:histidinol dehydrogenase